MKIKNFLLIILLLTNIVNIYNRNNEDDPKKFKQWESLFTNYSRRSCKASNQNENEDSTDFKSNLAKKNLGLPVPNQLTRDRFEIKLGRGDIGYLFDFLDPIFKSHIFDHFTKIWEQAKNPKSSNDNSIKDEYALVKILKENFNSDPSTDVSEINLKDPQVLERIKKILNKDFNIEVYSSSINMKQLNNLLRMWNYSESENAKKMIDRFDMDGDGRLNLREFILFTIIMIREADESSDVSYNSIFKKLIDPLYKYLDCKENEYITTEEFFDGVKYISRPTKLYDIYYCKVDDKVFHSVAFNDFLLKHNKFKTGKLLIDEFRRGILLGYWDRMTTKLEIKDSDELSEKNLRWKHNGKVDSSCEDIEEIMNLIN